MSSLAGTSTKVDNRCLYPIHSNRSFTLSTVVKKWAATTLTAPFPFSPKLLVGVNALSSLHSMKDGYQSTEQLTVSKPVIQVFN